MFNLKLSVLSYHIARKTLVMLSPVYFLPVPDSQYACLLVIQVWTIFLHHREW